MESDTPRTDRFLAALEERLSAKGIYGLGAYGAAILEWACGLERECASYEAREAMRPEVERKAPEVRLNDDKTLDEVVAKDASFHLEQMDRDHWWLEVESGGKGVSVWLVSKTSIRATYEHRDYCSPPQKGSE